MRIFYKFLFILLIALMLTACAAPQSVSVDVAAPAYWPVDGWQNATPESQGMDSAMLADMLEEISTTETNIHSLLVIRNGYLVTEAYFHPHTAETRPHVQSVTKSVIGALVGIALKDGLLTSVDQKALDFFSHRVIANPGNGKDAIQLSHLLSMSSGLDCEEFSGNGPRMEESSGWVQFILDLPMNAEPGKQFGYCNANAHLLSAILEEVTGMSAREYANQTLFRALNIDPVDEADWGTDPQGFSTGGYGLHLRPADLAKIAFLYLHGGQWNGQQVLQDGFAAASSTPYVTKEDGSNYGYLWTVYPEEGRYAALGLGGQQIHVYPASNLIVVVTADLEAYAEAPEIEGMLETYILPSIQSDEALAANPEGTARLAQAIAFAANPVQPLAALPATALEISGQTYTFTENPMGWQTMTLTFTPGIASAELNLNNLRTMQVGLDNIYRLNQEELFGETLLRAQWTDDHTLVVDYPYGLTGNTRLGELGYSEFTLTYTGERVDVTVRQMIFGGNPIQFSGSR